LFVFPSKIGLPLDAIFMFPLSWLLYFAVLEGVWGGTPGKMLCGLRVVRIGQPRPGVWRAGARAMIIGTSAIIAVIGVGFLFSNPLVVYPALLVLVPLLLSTARDR